MFLQHLKDGGELRFVDVLDGLCQDDRYVRCIGGQKIGGPRLLRRCELRIVTRTRQRSRQ
jgi:hypothetical protein